MATTTLRPQAIAGVSASAENLVIARYPSVAATGIGRALGMLYDCIPLGRSPVKLSHLLFVLPTAPIPALIYLLQRAFGDRYVVTNRSLQIWKSLGKRLVAQVPLSEIGEIRVRQQRGQAFYRAADLIVRDTAGKERLRLDGVPRAEVFRQNIIEARDARRQTEASLEQIRARGTK